MDLGISGRRAAVAAASAGLGLGCARALAAEGVQVAICGRHADTLDRATALLGHGAVGIVADVADEAQATRFVDEAAEQLGGLDILVANAGGPPPGTPTGTTVADYRAGLDLNLVSTIALTQAAVPHLRAGGWGRIVGITSIGVPQPIVDLAASGTARAGATWYLRALADEVAGDGITVSSVQPGVHDTDRLRSLGREVEELEAQVPLGTIGDPDDLGRVVAFLCSEPARFISGITLLVDGGAHRGIG